MGRELLIVWAGRHRRSTWEELCADYRRRIARSIAVRDVPVKVRAEGREGGGDAKRVRAEGRALLAALPDPCYVVALAAEGRQTDSAGLAAELARLQGEWPHPIAFLVGSDLGLAREVRAGARWVLSLGPLTLSHELARLVLYEQLYRALTIQMGMSYHREPV
ncbi:MAG TPA: 23S rRNA (pseudouridine(1915)-N(3))-methyltransferase RlmH [Thermoanaerobaculia bacterium]|nr:23S rRNA (pseudouridine(1915)-N(3))-methyltransferase RlmH [Thermoanaerobaculia bacterium]